MDVDQCTDDDFMPFLEKLRVRGIAMKMDGILFIMRKTGLIAGCGLSLCDPGPYANECPLLHPECESGKISRLRQLMIKGPFLIST